MARQLRPGEPAALAHLAEDNPAAAVVLLQKAFPGVPIWFGTFTRHYWALVSDRLVEAHHPAQLARILDDLTRALHAARRERHRGRA